MATLPRPGVEISQEVIVQAPTVLTPSLVPCVMGPCFQIVEPIDEDGALNAQAVVTTAARAVSTDNISQPLMLRSKAFVISVNGGSDEVITMPAAVNGDFSMSFALVVNTINKQLIGAVAEIVPGVVDGVAQPSKLVIRTSAKGPTASITLRPHPDGDAASAYGAGAQDIVNMNGLQGTTISGQTSYTNINYNIPYTSLPSPMTSADECVWAGEDISVYRYFSGSLYELSTDSAPGWNSYTLAPSRVDGDKISSSMQPALGNGKTKLWGIPRQGSETNWVASIGTSASIKIPLAHGVVPQATGSDTSWPDVTGKNYLTVSALGLTSKFLGSGNSDELGNFIGDLGNAIEVRFVSGANSISWNSGTPALTISLTSTSTFAELKAMIEDDAAFATSIEKDISVELSFADGDDTVKCVGISSSPGNTPWNTGAATFFLHGGSDPVDFSANAVVAGGLFSGSDDERKAWVAGSVNVGAASALTLGIGGHILSISIDGGVAIDIPLDPDTSVQTTIDAALSPVADASLAVVKTPLGEQVQVLKISTVSTNGHDSTIEISASSDLCLERLFGGSKAATDIVKVVSTLNPGVVAGLNPAVDERRWGVLGGTDYNKLVSTSSELAIEPGKLSIVTGGLALATIRTACTEATIDDNQGAGWVNSSAIKIDTGGATDTLAVDLNTGGTAAGVIDTMDELISALNTDIVAGPLNGLIKAHEANGVLCFTRTGAAIAAGQTIKIDYTTGTTTIFQTLLGAVGDTVATTTACTLTIKDTGVGHALRVTGVDLTSLAAPCPFGAPPVADPDDLTEYFLGGCTDANNAIGQANRGDKLSLVEYSEGDITIVMAGDSVVAPPADAVPVTFGFTGTESATISYERLWPCALGPIALSYNSRLYHGRSNQVMTADMLWDGGTVQGRVTGVEDWGIASSPFPGAKLVISEFSVKKGHQIADWHIVAENLTTGDSDDSGGNIRPEPEAGFNDLTQVYSIKSGVNRNSSGVAVANSTAPIYAKIKALRKDVSANTANPGLLVFSGIEEVISLIGPVDPANPLAFGLYQAFLSATGISLSGLGIGAVSADSPNGTVEAYTQALDFLGLHEVYAIAPMTHDMEVFKLLNSHVSAMSEASGKRERMGIVCPSLPTEENSTLVGSADFTIEAIGGGKYELSIADDAAAAAFNIPMAIDGGTNAGGNVLAGANGASYLPSDGVYVDREGDAFRYLVVGTPSARVITIETSDVYSPGESGPATSGNDDGYYRTGTDAVTNLSTFEADGELCTIKIRQTAIDMSGTAGKLKACETLAEIAGGVSGFQNRRMVMVQPERVGATVGGLEVLVPGYYLCAGIAGMVGQENPSQPFTNLPMVGFTRPVGSSDLFSDNQMSTAASGGIYWVIQDVIGGSCISRHQLTTDVTSLKTRELSILKSVDFVAKLLRSQVKRFIGRNNITSQLLETIALSMQSALASVSGSVVAEATLDSLEQSSAGPDEIIVGVSLVPFYPANKIKITIII